MLRPIRLITLAPGHFHAALVHQDMIPGVHPRVLVYAPLDDDLLSYIEHVHQFNTRPDRPTTWELDVRAGHHFLDRFAREQLGNTAVVTGRHRNKIDHILQATECGLHVLADKPWISSFDDFPKLEKVFREADLRDTICWDMMTERFEVTSLLQREMMRDPEVFGAPLVGTPDDPTILLESTHYLKKIVAGRPLRRSAWWFDPDEAGIALTDVGTHLADLAMWLLFPDTPIDYQKDIKFVDAACWPTPLSRSQLQEVTGLPDFPASVLPKYISGDRLLYPGNGTVTYTLKGAHVRLNVMWDFESETELRDTHEAIARGSKSKISVRHAPIPAGGTRPELYIAANDPAHHEAVLAGAKKRCAAWQRPIPGIVATDLGSEIRIDIPDRFRAGHEAHFLSVFREFMAYFHSPRQMPPWERPNLLAKYYVTTKAAQLAMQKQAK